MQLLRKDVQDQSVIQELDIIHLLFISCKRSSVLLLVVLNPLVWPGVWSVQSVLQDLDCLSGLMVSGGQITAFSSRASGGGLQHS